VTEGVANGVAPNATIGYSYGPDAGPTSIGEESVIRSGSIIYADVEIGPGLVTGHRVLIREGTTIGDNVVVGTDTVIDGHATIGSNVSLQTGVYIPQYTSIGDNVFIGPRAVLTNDKYPVRTNDPLRGPTIEDHVSIGANATILPDVTIGNHSFVAAGAVVTRDVPPQTLVVGVPAKHRPLPEKLAKENAIA
jgi:acetyltransferase-like isoleucine patch superfamily enzyme